MTARIGKEQEAKHAEPGTTNSDSGTECEGSEQTRDRARAEVVAPDCAQSPASKLGQHSGNPTAEKAEPYRQQILELLISCKGISCESMKS